MLPGVSGTLLGNTFLDAVLAEEWTRQPELTTTLRHLHRWCRNADAILGPASSLRLIADAGAIPLLRVLGYQVVRLERHGGDLIGTVTRESGREVVICVTLWSRDLDTAWRDAVRAGRTAGCPWAFLYNGRILRVVDAERTWARRTLDVALAQALADPRSARLAVALVQAAGASLECETPLETIVRRSEAHGTRVCESLGAGVLDALVRLATALDAARGTAAGTTAADRAVFEQAVTIVYRLLFLLFAEARAMVPTWHHVYRESYSLDALIHRLGRGGSARGVWRTLQAISRLAHAGCRAGDLVVTPFNGRLFSPRHAPLAERARLPDDVVGSAIAALATQRGRQGRERVAYADLDVEQLGTVYEHVLEFEPARVNGAFHLTRTSRDRKATGSFYTPRAMTDFLVRRALSPLTVNRTSEEILQLRVLDPAMGSGAFLVAACRFLAAALERALVAEGQLPPEPTVAERAALCRRVAQRCLFGVDRNPMAVQLARLSLWLCTLSGDRPLTFLDHRLASGNSLIGAWLHRVARHPRPAGRRRGGDGDAPTLFELDTASHLSRTVLPERLRIALAPDDSPAQVRDKERALATLAAAGTPLERWKRVADLWCAAALLGSESPPPGVYSDVAAAFTTGTGTLPPRHVAAVADRVAAAAHEHRFFHWELEFPEVFFTPDGHRDPGGGFDAVIGNPPWDVLRAGRGDGGARRRDSAHHGERLFLRDAGVYRHQGGGHVNRYQLFVERALQLARPGARVALIVPAGLATDHGSGPLRRHLLETLAIDRVFGFDNRHGIFPIHRDMRFLLMTGTTAAATGGLTCMFGLNESAWLDRLPDAAADDPLPLRGIAVSRALLDDWDPEHLSLPWLRDAADAGILATVLALPRLGAPAGWGVTFGRELNATDDRPHFVARPTAARSDLLTIIEGKHLEPFRVVDRASRLAIARARAASLVDASVTFARARLAYRDVASATNRVTLIAAMLPPGTISTHTVFCARTPLDADARYCLLALLNSLVANYLVRLQVTTHVTTALMARLPVPRPAAGTAAFRTLAALARTLAANGVAGHESDYAQVNAIAARLYGLSVEQYAHVLATFPLLPQAFRDDCRRRFAT